MSTIDKQRIAAVRSMEALGYIFDGADWRSLVGGACSCCAHAEADAMHSLLVVRAGKLTGCTKGTDDEGELERIADAVSAYEAKRWPDGVVPGGKGCAAAHKSCTAGSARGFIGWRLRRLCR
jgi:hypothetical protein